MAIVKEIFEQIQILENTVERQSEQIRKLKTRWYDYKVLSKR